MRIYEIKKKKIAIKIWRGINSVERNADNQPNLHVTYSEDGWSRRQGEENRRR